MEYNLISCLVVADAVGSAKIHGDTVLERVAEPVANCVIGLTKAMEKTKEIRPKKLKGFRGVIVILIVGAATIACGRLGRGLGSGL